jgi:O-antigen/teichoic acid export membrane protein
VTDDGISGLGRRSALGLAGAGVSGVGTIATLLIASRTLDSSGAGEFFVAISLFAIMQGLCSLGVDTGLQYFVPVSTPASARRLIRVLSIGSAALGLIVAAGVFALADPIGGVLAEGESTDGSATSMIRWIAVLLPFAGLYEVTTGALRACDKVFVATMLDRIIRPIAQVVAMLLAAAAGAGAAGAIVAWTLPNVMVVLVSIVLLVRLKLRESPVRQQVIDQAEFWRYNLPRAVARVAQTLTQRLDVLILATVGSLEDAGVYGTVSRCMIAGVFVATAVRQTIQPRLRRLIVRGDPVAVKNMYGASTTWLVLVTWPTYIAMIVFAPLVMSAFGPDYVRGASSLSLLSSAMLVASACGLVDMVLLMLGRSWLSTINVLIALVLNIVLNLALAPTWGMIGSATAWVVAILTTNLLPLWQTSRVGLHPGGEPLATVTSIAAVTIFVPLLVARLVFGTGLASFAIAFTIALAAYCAALYRARRKALLDRFVNDLRGGREGARAQLV